VKYWIDTEFIEKPYTGSSPDRVGDFSAFGRDGVFDDNTLADR
jgi:hypothetical protein